MRLYLLTAELVDGYGSLAKRLETLPHRTMLRIPIQWNKKKQHMEDPKTYAAAFEALSKVADLMITFADSSAMKHFDSPASFEKHVQNCLNALRAYCNAAEAGNEVNGTWLGSHTSEKIQLALAACHDAGLPAAVTYYFSADNPLQMFSWIGKHPLRSSYALISHYPNTTPGKVIDVESVFTKLASVFPGASIGWGEYGTEDSTEVNPGSMKERAQLIRRVEQDYWQMLAPAIPNYVGLGGYWDWATDSCLDDVFEEVWDAGAPRGGPRATECSG